MQFVVRRYEVRVQILYPLRVPVAVGNAASTSFAQLLQTRGNDIVVRAQMLGKKLAVAILRLVRSPRFAREENRQRLGGIAAMGKHASTHDLR